MCSLFVVSETWMSWYLPDVLTIEMSYWCPREEQKLFIVFGVSVQPKEMNSTSAPYRKSRLLTQGSGLLWRGQLPEI